MPTLLREEHMYVLVVGLSGVGGGGITGRGMGWA